MRLMHLGDLHLGKRVNAFSMVEDQRHILRELTDIALEQAVDAVLVAGDVYDRPTPSVQAVELADEFITSLVEAVKKIIDPTVPDYSTVALVIIAVAVVAKIVLGRYIGTNDFFVRKNGKYVFKEHDYIHPATK